MSERLMDGDGPTVRSRRRREGLDWAQLALGFTGLALALALILGVGLTITEGVAGLTGARDEESARSVASDLLVLTLLSGVAAAAVTEFLKRVLRLRESFNRAAVRRFLGRLSSFDWRLLGPEGMPVVAVPPTYGAPLSQLCAQLGQALALLATAVGEGYVRGDLRSLALHVLYDDPAASREVDWLLDEGTSPLRASATPPESLEELHPSSLTSALLVQAERQLDAFQLRTRSQWHRMLQWISAGVAAGFMLCVGVAVDAGWRPVVVACLLGLVIGGPVAWSVRDIVRLVERRA